LIPPYIKINIRLELASSDSILGKLLDTAPDATVSLTLAILFVRKQKVMSSFGLGIENLRASENNIKLLVPRTITNQQHNATGSRT